MSERKFDDETIWDIAGEDLSVYPDSIARVLDALVDMAGAGWTKEARQTARFLVNAYKDAVK